MSDNQDQKQEIVITPLSIKRILDPSIFSYRHLLVNLIRKDIRVSNDSTYLAFLWASARPLSMSLIFVSLRQLSSANMHVTMPYLAYLFSGYVLWFYFLTAVTGAASSLLKESGMIKKIYFPRLIIPLVPTLARFYDFFLSCIPLVFICYYEGVTPGINILFLPLILFLCMLMAFAVGAFFAAIGVSSKDPQKLLSVILQLGMFISPVIFDPAMIPQKIIFLYNINPMVGILMGFRAAIDHNMPFPYIECGYSILMTLLLLAISLYIYAKAEISLADKL